MSNPLGRALLRRPGVALGLAVSLLFAAVAPASAQTTPAATARSLVILQPWVRATPGGARIAAGYVTIRNDGDAPDRLIGATAEAAKSVTPHEMSMQGDVMSMRALPDGVTIPPHATVTLKPGAVHLMMEGLQRALQQGGRLSGSLVFEKAGTVPVVFAILGVGAQAPAVTLKMP
jgi:copper(I)-binding protein